MKIIYCIPAIHNSGGMERVLSLKANYLADKVGWDVTVITTCQHGKAYYYDFSDRIRFIDLGINYDEAFSLPIFTKIRAVSKKKKLHRKLLTTALTEQRPDIVVSMFTHETSFLHKIKDGSKKVIELHFSKYFRQLDDASNNASLTKRLLSKYLNWRDFSNIKHYDKFVVLTQRDEDCWHGIKNITYIHNPIAEISPECTAIDSKRVIAVGRLCAQKGFDTLIDIWQKVKQNNASDGWHLDIFGSGPDKELLQRKIADAGMLESIKINNPVKNIFSEFSNSAIYCLTSRYEGFAMTLSEALACGVPSIAFDCPCGPDEIIDEGECGYIVPLGNVDMYADRLLSLMKNEELRRQMSVKAKITAKKKFFIKEIMHKWVNLFENL